MPRSLSSRKRIRQNVKGRLRNRVIKNRIRTARRAFLEAVEAGDLDAARERLRTCEALLHRAANNGPIHRGMAGRLIGRMQKCMNAASAAN